MPHSPLPLRRAASVLATLLASLAAALFVAPAAGAQPASTAAAPALTDSLRLDPTVRAGVLPNGMHYSIKPNHKPEARVSLRLAVGIGATAEADDQRGLAHLCEHMNFNGSDHFKDADDLVAYLQSIGLRFGADANAYTSFDETVYMLDVPTDRDSVLDRGVTALSDFAGRAHLSEKEVKKERGVVLEEWRLGRGAGERMQRRWWPLLFKGSRYADRLPIGLPEIIQKAPSKRLRDFYHDWYTPGRMAVIAVGDVDPARMDSLIRVHFADLPGRAAALPTPSFDVPAQKEAQVCVATDKEATGTQVAVYVKNAHRGELTVADYRRGLAEALFGSMLNARLNEIAHRAHAPFLGGGAFGSALGRSLDIYGVAATVADGGAEKGLSALLEEVARVRQHGFLDVELDRAKEELKAQNERAWAEREKTESNGMAAELVSSYLTHEPAPGIEAGYLLTKALLPGITLQDVSARTQRLTHNDNRLVLVTAPEKAWSSVPTEDALGGILAAAADLKTEAWVDTTAGKPLMAEQPKPGTIISRRVIEEIGTTVLTLSNGVEVWLKPTDFKADEIQFSAYSLGGLSLADSADFTMAFMTSAIVNDGGVGGFKSAELQKMLSGKLVRANPSFSLYTHGLSGSARPADLETALQLVYLGFTQPTEDPDGFAALKQKFHAVFADRANSPELVFQDTLNAVNTGRFYMSQIPTLAQFDDVKLGAALDFHRRHFANAADFSFFFAGNFAVDSIAPLLERYLGSLPSTGKRTATYRPIGPRYPKGVSTVRVHKGLEPKSSTRITFFTTGGVLEELDLHRARACANILNDHLRERLREMLSGTYGASASVSYTPPLSGYTTAIIAFGCAPENVDKMVAAALDEVKKLREQGPSAADVQKDQEVERRELEVAMKQNAFWTGSLQTVAMLGWDPKRIAKRRERIDLLTPANLKETFRKYFPLDRYTVATLLPEASAGAGDKTGMK